MGKIPLVTAQPGCHTSGTWVLSPGALFYGLREDVRPAGRETPPGSCCRALLTPKMRPSLEQVVEEGDSLPLGVPAEEQGEPELRAEELGAHPAPPVSSPRYDG